MDKIGMKKISKTLSLVLRHNPDHIGIKLDPQGWALVTDVMAGFKVKGFEIDQHILDQVVTENDKQRFAYNFDRSKIRANQGHSVSVDLKLRPQKPPHTLYHGTIGKFMKPIRKEGLMKMARQHVHLSAEKHTAQIVGARRGAAIILKVEAHRMFEDGFDFFVSENGVWLTEHVPPRYILES